MCKAITRQQWLDCQRGAFTADARQLAQLLFDRRDVDLGVLGDSLADSGHDSLREHFTDPATPHPGPGRCWALLVILGRLPAGVMLLGTPAAAEWLGISAAQFRRLAGKVGLDPADHYDNPHHRGGPPCPLWDPAQVLAVPDVTVASIKARRCPWVIPEDYLRSLAATREARAQERQRQVAEWRARMDKEYAARQQALAERVAALQVGQELTAEGVREIGTPALRARGLRACKVGSRFLVLPDSQQTNDVLARLSAAQPGALDELRGLLTPDSLRWVEEWLQVRAAALARRQARQARQR